MAAAASTYTRYTAANNVREDLADFISRQDPESTPIISSAGRAKASQTLLEWSRDGLRAPDADNAAIDGDDDHATLIEALRESLNHRVPTLIELVEADFIGA